MKKSFLAAIVLSAFIFGASASSIDPSMIEDRGLDTQSYLADWDKPVITSDSIAAGDAVKLKQQLLNLKDGDELVIPSGKYEDMGQFEITASNVTIRAQEPGTTWFTGSIQIILRGNDITLDGVVFTEGGPAERMGGIIFRGDNNKLVNSTLYYFIHGFDYQPDERRTEYPKVLWIAMYGKNNQLIDNTFEGKHKRGTLIGVQKASSDETADKHLIKGNLFYNQQHNQFNEFDNSDAIRYNSNSWEAIRLGDSKSSIFPSETTIEGNLFLQMDGETELVSLKSGGNTVRGNTIIDSSSMISLRHGINNTVEDNVILGNNKDRSGGIRLYDAGHNIRNNYIERVMGTGDVRGGIAINTGITDVLKGEKLDNDVKGKELNKQATPYQVNIESNTIIDSRQNFLYSDKRHRVSLYDNSQVTTVYAGTDVTFKNNISYAQASGTLALKANDSVAALVNPTYDNNLYMGTIEGTELPSKGTVNDDPKFKVAENGLLEATNFDGGARGLTVLSINDTGASYRISE
ncbi:polysaccharide lyase 6 family protein [Photobacterium minamisatsumaniensis]|uniref:polysaccharide lyase 6 family protein n=1 Tax=Photobacterium minamisatsumaniensis TaxID=2910233 RepID=UPI003D14054F